ncbi:MAG TPA: OFA family MFS transporter [Propionibacterium sp.]|jgi:OFA family oxalate/formate antiporter-like MFS transporter|nr:OFA family MFS transporter [Propionibacterium sp.]
MANLTDSTAGPATARTPNRWLILAGGLLVQLALGGVYAWSTFAKALQAEESFGLSPMLAAIPFEVAIGMIFVGSFVGGRMQDKRGPRMVGLIGAVIYAAGIMIASLARSADDLWLLILGYGVIGGIGLGVAYIVPIALLQQWFPDKRGLITGIAVGGFGFGAVITSPAAQALISGSTDFQQYPTKVFLYLGIAYLIAGLLGAATFVPPPAGYAVPGTPTSDSGDVAGPTPEVVTAGDPTRDYTQAQALRTPQWYLLTAILAIAVIGGISLVSQAASTASGVAGFSPAAAATLVGIMGLFNGGGRMGWAALSDKIGRMPSFVAILVILGVSLILIPRATSPALFYVLAALIYLCYGGAFGTMPSTAGDFFGLKNAGSIYGLMLIAWSIGGVVGPLLISALIGTEGNYVRAYTVVGVLTLVGAILPFITKRPRTADRT